jgi:hypothetical protein
MCKTLSAPTCAASDSGSSPRARFFDFGLIVFSFFCLAALALTFFSLGCFFTFSGFLTFACFFTFAGVFTFIGFGFLLLLGGAAVFGLSFVFFFLAGFLSTLLTEGWLVGFCKLCESLQALAACLLFLQVITEHVIEDCRRSCH